MPPIHRIHLFHPSLLTGLFVLGFVLLPHQTIQAQTRSVSFNSAYQMLNGSTTTSYSSSNISYVGNSGQQQNSNINWYYDQYSVFYGVPVKVASDWFSMRIATVLADGADPDGYWSMTQEQRDAADALKYDDFVPASAYAVLTISLDFRFAVPWPQSANNADFSNYGPVKGQKFLYIR